MSWNYRLFHVDGQEGLKLGECYYDEKGNIEGWGVNNFTIATDYDNLEEFNEERMKIESASNRSIIRLEKDYSNIIKDRHTVSINLGDMKVYKLEEGLTYSEIMTEIKFIGLRVEGNIFVVSEDHHERIDKEDGFIGRSSYTNNCYAIPDNPITESYECVIEIPSRIKSLREINLIELYGIAKDNKWTITINGEDITIGYKGIGVIDLEKEGYVLCLD